MRSVKVFFLLVLLVFLVGIVGAQQYNGFRGNDNRGSALFSNYYGQSDFGNYYGQSGFGNSYGQSGFQNYYSQPDFQDYYRSGGRLDTYYPIFGDPESCIAREDIILRVPIGGCQPSVVRSDLLADQNVPVFCQIEAIKLNPLVDVKEIRNIRFRGDYPPEVVGTGFHPARAALRTQTRLLGSPIVNNIGYVAVILRQNDREEDLPDVVNFTLNAQLEYRADNAFGTGRAEFLLEEQTDSEWESDKFKQSFWQGRFFLRLDDANNEFAIVSIYDGDRKISTLQVDRGRTSREIYVPGSYCQYGLRIDYSGFQSAADIAQLKVGDDVVDVYDGSRFLNNKCVVRDIELGDLNDGSVEIQCGSDRFTLSIGVKNASSVDLSRIDEDNLLPYEISIETLNDFKLVDEFNDFVIVNQSGGLDLFGYSTNVDDIVVVYNDNNVEIIQNSSSKTLSELGITLHTLPGYERGTGLREKIHPDDDAEFYFAETIKAYEQVADDYPSETRGLVEGEESFGERALFSAIELAQQYGKEETYSRLLNKFLDIYPNSGRSGALVVQLNELNSRDFTFAGKGVNIDNEVTFVRLLDVKKPKTRASAKFSWDNTQLEIDFEDTGNLGLNNITLTSLDVDRVRVTPTCGEEDEDGEFRFVQKSSKELRIGESGKVVCNKLLKLNSVDLQETAKVRIVPAVRGTDIETNFTVGVGIEKRAIELTPSKAKERADDLEEKIQDWESISDGLGKAVKGFKSACFATAGALTIKNFFTGLDGEGIARQRVMQDKWRGICQEEIANGQHGGKLSACYYENRDEIGTDVSSMQQILQDFDSSIENLEVSSSAGGLGGLFGERGIDGEASAIAVAKDLKGESFKDLKGNTIEIDDLIGTDKFEEKYGNGTFSYSSLREMKLNLELVNSLPEDDPLAKEARTRLENSAESIKRNIEDNEKLRLAQELASQGYARASFAESKGQRERVVDVVKIKGNNVLEAFNWEDSEITHSSTFVVTGSNAEYGGIDPGEYVVGAKLVRGKTNVYSPVKVFDRKDPDKEIDAGDFMSAFGIGLIVPVDQVVYNNHYKDPEVRFFETEPYKGLPAIVPFDIAKGWYAATRQTLPVLGNVGSFESSGRVASFFLCNVGNNGLEQFSEGIGDDQCQMINLNTGQPLDKFPGLSDEEARRKIDEAIKALQSAAQQYSAGVSFVTINGETFRVGDPAAGTPGTECAEFMSPEECNTLFNVCDPVICPSSRCDLGGAYPVADVIQTGIVGSTLLCLPNIQEGIAVPICLTGIQAGVDNYLSIMKSHQACLREAADTGRLVGICDEITSVYTCEFFWRQVAPATSVLLPKLVEVATGETAPRGGGEYITVQNAWQHTQDSVSYFTDSYAVNSLEAFNVRSAEEAGSTFCRAFIGRNGVDAFDSLVEPDSPHQFYAWFSSTRLTDVTVPATAQYKVFYHIFAGNDIGASFSVFLKDPPGTSFYQTTPTIQVDRGFIPRGEFFTETIDFTAPEGYQQLCVRVNGREECGFKQVSTDFAVNYLRDQYVSGQITETNINSETECISGSPNLGALVNPNIQAGIEEVALPEIYDRGVIRICATGNPGSATDPQRFVDVGNCGDENLRCWLDQRSIGDSITQNNLFLKNKTLDEIQDFQRENLEADGVILPDTQIESGIAELDDSVSLFTPGEFNVEVKNEANSLVDRAEDLFLKAFFNSHKANLVFLEGEIYNRVAGIFIDTISPGPATGDDDFEEEEVSEEESGGDEPKTYEASFNFLVDGEVIVDLEEDGADVGDVLELKVEHSCDYVRVLVQFEGENYLDEDNIVDNYETQLPTNSVGTYLAAVGCYNSEGAQIGDTETKRIDVFISSGEPVE